MTTLSLLMLAAPAWAQGTLTATPLNLGRVTKLSVTGATAGQLVYFTASTQGAGVGPCTPTPNVCADILNPMIIGTQHANANGEAWLYVPLNPAMLTAGQQVAFQAFPKSGRQFTETNVVAGPIVQPAYTRCYDPGVDATVVRVPTVVSTTFENKALYYYMPASPRGVIFYFTGGASASEVLYPEQTALLWNQMGINENFGIVAIDRSAPGAGGTWDTSSPANSNPDSQRLDRLRDWLITNTGMTNATPIALTGFSDGAGFATYFASHALNTFAWPLRAVTPHNGAYGNAPPVASLWTIGENDSAQAIQNLGAMQASMTRAGTDNLARTAPERIVTANQFMRDPTWELADAQAVVADMQAFGLINGAGVRTVADSQIDSEIDAWVASTTVFGAPVAGERLRVLWSTHRYTSYENQTECDWIRDRI